MRQQVYPLADGGVVFAVGFTTGRTRMRDVKTIQTIDDGSGGCAAGD